MLMKYPDIYNTFIRMNIDVNPQTKQRPANFYKIQEQLNKKIVRVPTIIVTDKNSEVLLLSDKDAFRWLDFQVNLKKQETKGITGFNINEMGSFSDGYSSFDKNNTQSTDINNATEQNFKFYKNVNGKRVLPGEHFELSGQIQGAESFADKTVQDNTFNQEIYNNLENERSQFDKSRPNMGRLEQLESMSVNQPKVNDLEYNTKLNAFRQDSQSRKPPANIDFTNVNFGLAQGQQNTSSQKSKDFDSRLDQLLLDRQM